MEAARPSATGGGGTVDEPVLARAVQPYESPSAAGAELAPLRHLQAAMQARRKTSGSGTASPEQNRTELGS